MSTARRRWVALGVSGLLAAAGALVLTSSGVSAVGTVSPNITGDPNAANGTISFYDASGNQISGGPLGAPFTGYAVASSATTRTGTPKATLFVATPDHTKADSRQWFNQQLTAASTWPLVGAPAGVAAAEGAGVPAVAIGAGDGDLGGAFTGAVNDPTTGYDHIMQIRLEDSGPGKAAAPPFWQADVWIDPVAGTWTQVYPTPPPPKTATSVAAITANPAGPAPHGSTVTLTSTVSAADSSHPAGAVELFDGGTDKGAATFTPATGAVTATDTPSDGSHNYTFRFSPSDPGSYTGSTSAALAYTVNPPISTSTTLVASPSSPSTVGDPVTLTATVTPSSAAGTVQFFNGASAIGSPVALSSGTASTSTSSLTIGSHSLSARFTPTSGAFVTSTSAALTYQVNPAPATSTTTTLAVSPSGPVAFGSSVTLTGTVSPSSAVGSVQFLDGSTALGSPVTVVAGTASKSISTLGSGDHALTAKFLPTDSTAFGTSTSAPASVTVNAQDTSTALVVTPAGPVNHAQSVNLKANLTPSSAVGTVQFFDGASPLGSPVTVSGGIAQLSTSSLTVATHSLTAAFTPTNPALYAGSTSAAVSLVVQNPPPGATTTSLAVHPASPAVSGTSVTLTATISPSGAAGTVQFSDLGNPIGSPVTVSGGTASFTETPILGSHTFSASFTPADPVSFAPSTSSNVTLQVIPPPTPTTTSLSVTPAGPVAYGTAVTFTATVTPTNVGDPAPTGGNVRFSDGSTVLGTVSLTGGATTLTTSTLTGGSHPVTATYLPADSTAFAGSSSAVTTLVVNAQPTSSTLTGPAKATAGTDVTLTATLAPSTATGTVDFTDGSTSLGTAPVSGGKAVLVTTTLSLGDHSITAAYTPADPARFAASSSAAVAVSIVAPPVVGGVSSGGGPVSSGGMLSPGASVTITGSGFQPDETVTVLLDSHSTLTTVTADNAGNVSATVTLPSTLSAGQHALILHGTLASATFHFAVEAASATGTPTPVPSSSSSSVGTSGAGSSGGTLPFTGSQALGGLTLGLLLLVTGVGLLLGSRRRSH